MNKTMDTLLNQKSLEEELETALCEKISSILVRREPIFVAETAAVLAEYLSAAKVANAAVEQTSAPWVVIASLSQLRAEVGGRFDNIKKKWLDAGFPLRDTDKDGNAACKVDANGWNELNAWLIKQGYEARLCAGGSKAYFEVRKVER